MGNSYMPKSKSNIHVTPDSVFDLIKEIWGYTKRKLYDPCPLNPKRNGLDIPWGKVNIINPPYDQLPESVAKAYLEKLRGKKSIMLLPAKTDQDWFHDFILYHGYELHWIHGRLKFKNDKWLAPQSHFLVMIE